MQNNSARRAAEKRKKHLLTMLGKERFQWRRLSRMARVIGADEETTKRLLIEVDARGSEGDDDLWGLIERNPFPDEQ